MPRLVDDPQFPDFGDSIGRWEGLRRYFYGDRNGLVTLGIGHLFDHRGTTPGMSLEYGRGQAGAAMTHYQFSPNGTFPRVYNDWLQVKLHVLSIYPNVNVGPDVYEGLTQLTISREDAIEGAKAKVRQISNPIYHAHPALEHFDAKIAMAIVDIRFNPGPVGVLSATFAPIWTSLTTAASPASGPAEKTRAAQTAYDHFRVLYAGVPVRTPDNPHGLTERYFRRHHQRVQRLREGMEATFGVTISMSAADEEWHY